MALIHGNKPPGLVAKLAIYSALIEQHAHLGDTLWKIEPLLYPLIQSVEIDLHLASARVLERPGRSDRSLFKFLEFCEINRANIAWHGGSPSAHVLREQQDQLELHRKTISMIMGRRDKFFAHLDKKYFGDPAAMYADYPLAESDVIALVNSMISIIAQHQASLHGSVNFHVGEFYRIYSR